MPVKQELIEMLCCPVERRPLRLMAPDDLRALNRAIATGHASDAGGARVVEAIESGLATVDGASFYPVQEGVPVLVPARRITIQADALPENLTSQAPAPADASEALWAWLASQWKNRKPPARPSPQDIALLQRLVGDALAGRDAPRALLLGVTPEIATMRWPSGTQLLAIDASAAMIREVWPAGAVPHAELIRGEWAAMPIRDGVFDIIVGDASLGFQPYPDAFFGVVAEVRRVLRDDGFVATRVYTRPETREPLEAIFADLRAGRIGSLEFLWWRLYTAQHGGRARGALAKDIWEAWAAYVPDPAGLIRSLGWPPEDLQAMESLRSSPHPMIFPTLREFRDDIAGSFEEIACESPDFEDGDRNPTLVLKARPR